MFSHGPIAEGKEEKEEEPVESSLSQEYPFLKEQRDRAVPRALKQRLKLVVPGKHADVQ